MTDAVKPWPVEREGGDRMEAYTDFAKVYDTFMDDTPYAAWAEYVHRLLTAYGVSDVGREGTGPGKEPAAGAGEHTQRHTARAQALRAERNVVVDLGCGTGSLTELLAAAGYDMIGIDSSWEMLSVALSKKERSGSDILYLLQDMRELELYGTVGAMVSVCDSLNYILEERELLTVLRLVNNYLYPGGVFVFDFNTVYKYETVIGNATIAENREDCSFIWENDYDPESGLNEYDLTVFVRVMPVRHTGELKAHGTAGQGTEEAVCESLFRRFAETHLQRGYTLKQMCSLVEQAGMEVVAVADADTRGAVRKESERIYVVAKEIRKEKANE